MSERQRWVEIFVFPEPSPEQPTLARDNYRQMMAVVRSFQKVGRVVRVERPHWNASTLVLKARRA